MTANKFILLLASLLFFSIFSNAQQTFTPVFKTTNLAKAESAEDASAEILRTGYLQLDQTAEKGEPLIAKQMQFNLFEDVKIDLTLEKSTRDKYQNLEVYTGRSKDKRFAHLPQYRDAVVVVNPTTGTMTAVIENEKGRFQITPMMKGNSYKVVEFSKKPFKCELIHESEIEVPPAHVGARTAGCEEKDQNGIYVTDLFVGYSDLAAAEVGDINAHALTLVTMVNNGLTNSQVTNIYVRLVGTATSSHNPGVVTSVLSDVYTWFSSEILSTGADYVASVQKPTGAAGEAGGWGGVGGYSSVNSIYSTVNVFRHEIGHNLGGGHCPGNGSSFPHAHGYNNGNWRTHLCGNDVNFYSNPNINDDQGNPIGDAATADMARVWTDRAEEISNRNFHTIPFFTGDTCFRHCKPIHVAGTNEYMTNVTLNTINNSSAAGNSSSIVGYSDFSSVSTDLTMGTSYTLTVTPNHSFNDSKVGFWADWDQDLVFESNELIASFAGKGPWTATVTPPANATLGNVKLRLRLQYSPTYTPDPCASTGYNGGETEDYTINVLPNCSNTVIEDWDVENGWYSSIWNDGGSDCRRNSSDAAYASSGTFCIRLRDDDVTSHTTTDVLDLSTYEDLTVSFGYYAVSFDNADEDFWLQISTDGGTTFTTKEEWNLGDEFNNNEFKTDQVTIDGPFTANTVVRFRCDASGNADKLYLDDIELSGCSTGGAQKPIGDFDDDVTVDTGNSIDFRDSDPHIETFDVFPNPFNNRIFVETEAPEILIFNQTGQLVKRIKNQESGFQKTEIDMTNLPAGMYFVRAGAAVKKLVKP